MIAQRDPEYWNRIANDPGVRPHIGGEGPIDLTEALAEPSIVPLAGEHGGFLFVPLSPDRYELHTMFLPEGRGRGVLALFAEAARHLFAATDCREIVTKVPDANRAARYMATKAGFRMLFRREAAWPDGGGIAYYILTLDEWATSDTTALEAGRAFHDLLETAKRASGSQLPTHPDDDAHDHAAGVACLMAKVGKAVKAVWFYNRWAGFAGYAPIQLVSEQPPTIDVGDAIVAVNNQELEVLTCRGEPLQP